MYNPIDSISPHYSQNNVVYYGVRLWPKEYQNKEAKKRNIEQRFLLMLEMGDTLTIVSDDSRYFNNEIYSISTKKKARQIYKGYRLDFEEELPKRFIAISSSDTIIYEKDPSEIAPYQLTKGIIRSNSTIGIPIEVGMKIKSLVKEIGANDNISTNNLSKYKYIIIVHPMYLHSNYIKTKYTTKNIWRFHDAVFNNKRSENNID